MPSVTRPFAAIPAEAADVLRPVLPGLAEETIAAIAADVPEYAREMEGEFGRLVRLGVEVAFNRFVDLIADPNADGGFARETYINLGRGEFRAGRSLDVLLAAYRVGARLAWRRFVEAGGRHELPPEVLYQLGEAIFAYIDELSAESAEGYAEEQSAAAGESQRRRRRLVRLLAQHPPATADSLRTAAQATGWPLPRTLAAVVIAETEQAAGPPTPDGLADGRALPGEEIVDAIATRLARRLGPDAIGGAVGGAACVFLPDPDAPGRRRQLVAALAAATGGEETAALGPTVGFERAGSSMRRAIAAFHLAADGRLPGSRLVVAEDHLGALLLAADAELAADLARTRLSPLAELPPGPRARLAETLRAWIDRPGQVQAVAAVLDVHPQTVRYRVRRLRELFGDALEDPERRFELGLALRV
jgi:PucR-like helix-turn-helix protein/diguanylate cyclase with GGDEF domain